MALFGFIRGLREVADGGDTVAAQPPAPEARAIMGDLNSSLKALQQQVDTKQAEMDARRESAGKSSAMGGVTPERATQLIAEAQAAMKASIVEMHQKLGTGLTDADLGALRTMLCGAAEAIDIAPTDDIDRRVRGAIIKRVFEASGPIAWERVNELMKGGGVHWPWESEGETERSRRQKAAETEALVAESNMIHNADLLVGAVPVWRWHYPERDSDLWREVTLRGAAAGIRAALAKTAVLAIKDDFNAMRDEVKRLFAEQLDAVRTAIKATDSDVDQMTEVLAQSTALFSEFIPDFCWQRIEEKVRKASLKPVDRRVLSERFADS